MAVVNNKVDFLIEAFKDLKTCNSSQSPEKNETEDALITKAFNTLNKFLPIDVYNEHTLKLLSSDAFLDSMVFRVEHCIDNVAAVESEVKAGTQSESSRKLLAHQAWPRFLFPLILSPRLLAWSYVGDTNK